MKTQIGYMITMEFKSLGKPNKGEAMKEYLKELLHYSIYRTIWTKSFIRRIEWKNIFDWLDLKKNDRILDVACGTGELSLHIARKGCETCGIDISKDAIKRAKRLAKREKTSLDFIVADAEELPFKDESFDKIVCSSSLEHFNMDLKALKEMNRVLKPNGTIILTTDSFTYPISKELKEEHRKKAHVVNYYTRESLEEKFEISGFKMIQSKYLLSSPITSFFFKIGIKTSWSGIWWTMISLVAYPLCLLSEKLFRKESMGYTLLAKGRKVTR